MAAGASTLTKNDYIDLVHGEFDQTNSADLDAAFRALVASGTNHLAVFFHGGLVGRANAMRTAEQLIGGYRNAGAYPFFFIWNSDLWTALQRLLSPLAEDHVVRRIVEQHIRFVCRQMVEVGGLTSGHREILSQIANRPREEPPPTLAVLAERGRTIDAIWAQRTPGATLADATNKIDAFEKELADDPTLVTFGRWLNQNRRFTPQLGGGIIRRVIERMNSGHDHGLYTTLIEEIGIAIGLDVILSGIWYSMKADVDDGFRGAADRYGGTAFLDLLSNVWNSSMRLTLIGHSGGAVYINRMLNAIDDRLAPEIQADVVFIAAAVSCQAFAETIDSTIFARRVRSYRFFALDDKHEGGYWEVPGVYDKSMLYLLSALCERDSEADRPLVGMYRYWRGTAPYDTPDLKLVTGAIAEHERVWSPTAMTAPDGHRANARYHVGFPVEAETNRSVQHFLRYR